MRGIHHLWRALADPSVCRHGGNNKELSRVREHRASPKTAQESDWGATFALSVSQNYIISGISTHLINSSRLLTHSSQMRTVRNISTANFRVFVISVKNHKRQRRKRQSVTAKQEKSTTPKFVTAIQT